MPIPSYETLMLSVLKYGNEGVIEFKEAVNRASDEFNLTDEERRETIPSGTESLIRNRTGWSITYMVKAELLYRPKRAYFTITERGKMELAKNPEAIGVKDLKQYSAFKKFYNKKNTRKSLQFQGQVEASLETPEERIGVAYDEITTEVRSELLTKILELSPVFFEHLILKLLVSMGYGNWVEGSAKHLGGPGDGGIDGIINEDKLGLGMICVQAKRYAPEKKVGSGELRDFAGSLNFKCVNKGVFVTTSSFSTHALRSIEKGSKRIILIDGEKLTSLMLEHNVGVRVNRSIELKRIDEDFFMEI